VDDKFVGDLGVEGMVGLWAEAEKHFVFESEGWIEMI
jgi:hypothetical protein